MCAIFLIFNFLFHFPLIYIESMNVKKKKIFCSSSSDECSELYAVKTLRRHPQRIFCGSHFVILFNKKILFTLQYINKQP